MQDFSGIAHKLKRAKENIANLRRETESFFQESDYPVLPQNDRQAFLKAIEYHENRVIPLRFSVLSGEIIHHLRACFDHIVWHFSELPVNNKRKLEFPVFWEKPSNDKGRKHFDGKIEGIADSAVRSLIEACQPYNVPEPRNSPLWIIHDLDIVDKHRELLIFPSTGSVKFPPEMKGTLEAYERAHPDLDPTQVARHFARDGTPMPSISFRDFGMRGIQPVIQGLQELFNYTVVTVASFERLAHKPIVPMGP